MDRLKEASTAAGVGLILNALPKLFATGFADPFAWGEVVAGVIAIIKREGAHA